MAMAEAKIRIEGQDRHWPASAQELDAACIMAERLDSDDGSLEGVRQVLGAGREKFVLAIQAMMELARSRDCPELAVKAARFADFESDNREMHAILSTALTQTRWLDSRAIKRDLRSTAAHDFARLKDRPTTVYLVLPPQRLATHATWLRLMISTILQPLLKSTSPAKVPVLLMLDEYPALAEGDGFPVIARNMAMFRGFGIKLWTVWQDLSQARRIYGEEWESFAANAGILQSFAPQDVFTADYLSQRSGITTRLTLGIGETNGQKSANVNEQGMPLMLPQALRNIDPGFSVIFSHKAKGMIRAYMPFPDLAQA